MCTDERTWYTISSREKDTCLLSEFPCRLKVELNHAEKVEKDLGILRKYSFDPRFAPATRETF
jgi:hypothetical protein